MSASVPWDEIELITIDSGNTLFGMDFGWVAESLAERGILVTPVELEAADCAARPMVSKMRMSSRHPPGTGGFELYLGAMLKQIESTGWLPEERRRATARELAPLLDGPGQKRFLWARLLPGVRRALELFDGAGLRVVLVSNSDGTVEEKLRRYEIRDRFHRVVDSAVVGVRKPDPAIFRIALEGFGIPPERAVHVGDFYHADVVGARNAGLHSVLLDPAGSWKGWDCMRLPTLLDVAHELTRERP